MCLRYAVLGVGGQEARHGCAFEIFFSQALGTTPQELIRAGIYNGIAIGLKGGPWRRASLMMVAKTLAKHAAAVRLNELHSEMDEMMEGASAVARRASQPSAAILRYGLARCDHVVRLLPSLCRRPPPVVNTMMMADPTEFQGMLLYTSQVQAEHSGAEPAANKLEQGSAVEVQVV